MQHHIVFDILFFLIGSAFHTLAQIDAIARSKNNPDNSRMSIFLSRWPAIAVRTGITMAIFMLWLQGQLVSVLAAIKVPIPPTVDAVLDLHVGGAIASLAGYFFDSLLAFVPILKNSIPPPIDAPAQDQKPAP